MKVCIYILIAAALLLVCACRSVKAPASIYSEVDYLSRGVSFKSKDLHYRVYVPKDKAPGERLPVMLFLHGSDDRGDDNQRAINGLAEFIRADPARFRFIIVFPQCGIDRFWDKEMIGYAIKSLDQTIAEFGADENRLYLAGFSLGGYGVWATAAAFPGKFAAIMPMSGRVLPRPGERKNMAAGILELVDSADPYAAFANRIGNTPVWIFHGSNDNIVPVESSRKMAKAFKDSDNNNVIYSELDGVGHYSLDPAFRYPELFKWLALQQRKL